MDAHHRQLSIGELSRMTGLPVRTIRFYADSGLVAVAGRTGSGYRQFAPEAAERLALVRTLRELGVDLPTIGRVLAAEVTIGAVAALHAQAVELQIRSLRLRRLVLQVIATRGTSPKEVELMHKLTQLSDAERRRMVEDFVDEVFRDVEADPKFVAMMRTSVPELPEEPSTEQLEAWVELGELLGDPAFRQRIRQMAEGYAAERAAGDSFSNHDHQLATKALAEQAQVALDAGIDAASPEARPVIDRLVAQYGAALGRPDDQALRDWLMGIIDQYCDRRAERYWQLLGIINGWPPVPSVIPAWEWAAAALQAQV